MATMLFYFRAWAMKYMNASKNNTRSSYRYLFTNVWSGPLKTGNSKLSQGRNQNGRSGGGGEVEA